MQMPDTYYSQDVLAMITLIWGAHAGVGGWCQSWPAQDLRWDFLSAQWQTLLPCRCGVHSQVARAESLVVRLEMALFLFKCVSCWQASTQVLLTVESRLFQPFYLTQQSSSQTKGIPSTNSRTGTSSMWPPSSRWVFNHIISISSESPPRGTSPDLIAFLPFLLNYVCIFLTTSL